MMKTSLSNPGQTLALQLKGLDDAEKGLQKAILKCSENGPSETIVKEIQRCIAESYDSLLKLEWVCNHLIANPSPLKIEEIEKLTGDVTATYARAAAVASRTTRMLKDYTVKDVLVHDIPTIDEHALMSDAASMLLNSQSKNLLVINEGTPVGTISRNEILQVLKEHGEDTTVGECKNQDLVYLPINAPLDKAWTLMQQVNKPMVLVESDGQLRGAVDDENIAELILIQTARTCSFKFIRT